MQIIILIAIVIGVMIYHKIEDARFDNFSTKDVSWGKVALDHETNPRKIRRKMMRGEYNKDNKFKI